MLKKLKEFLKNFFDFRNKRINAKKAHLLKDFNVEPKSDMEILKEFEQQGLSQSEAEKKLDIIRNNIEKAFNITALSEFGKNYAEYYNDGANAIKKLLNEKQGQVAGAFYRDGLGEIDLVWGNDDCGLEHILNERVKQWGENKALGFISHLADNIQSGVVVEIKKARIGIKTKLTTIILDKKGDNTFVLTAFRDKKNKRELESLNLSQSKTFTGKNAETNAKDSPVTSPNQHSNPTTKKQTSQAQNSSNELLSQVKNLNNSLRQQKIQIKNIEIKTNDTLLQNINTNDDNGIKLKSLVDASENQSSNKQSSSPKGADKLKIKWRTQQ